MTPAYTRKRLWHFFGWCAFDLTMCAALVLWAGVEGWRAVAVAVVWNVAGYVQGRARSRLEVQHG